MSDERVEKLCKLRDRLQSYNKWRRGSDAPMPSPTQIGEDIDAAIGVIEAKILDLVDLE